MLTKYNNYIKWIKKHQDKDGFILSSHCDATLFSGLIGCVPGIEVNITAAHDPYTDMWHRRPITLSACCELESWSLFERIGQILKAKTTDKVAIKKIFEKGSSTISRDMLMGILYYSYYNNRLDISESVIRYALSHWCIMGIGSPTRTFLTPGLLSTFAWVSYRLGGPSRPWLRYLPQSENKTDGFQAQ